MEVTVKFLSFFDNDFHVGHSLHMSSVQCVHERVREKKNEWQSENKEQVKCDILRAICSST